jgi:hypothetical protein
MLEWSGMAFRRLWWRRNLRRPMPWCHCAAALGNPELFEPLAGPGKSLGMELLVFCVQAFYRANGFALGESQGRSLARKRLGRSRDLVGPVRL